jgi:NADH:ubiquinone oxidoreductase subunit 3 (subunit A)
MLSDVVTAFTLIFAMSLLIYMLGRYLSSKPSQTENERALYACGEKADFSKPRITVSLYKYLIYFVVMDSSVMLVAFATLALSGANVLLFVFYLSMLLASGFLLAGGGDQ